jgi:hypothetical protein
MPEIINKNYLATKKKQKARGMMLNFEKIKNDVC